MRRATAGVLLVTVAFCLAFIVHAGFFASWGKLPRMSTSSFTTAKIPQLTRLTQSTQELGGLAMPSQPAPNDLWTPGPDALVSDVVSRSLLEAACTCRSTDNTSFRDENDYSCNGWKSYDCETYEGWYYKLTAAGRQRLLCGCPVACKLRPGTLCSLASSSTTSSTTVPASGSTCTCRSTDNTCFRDENGYSCNGWKSYDCETYEGWYYKLTAAGRQSLLCECPVACKLRPGTHCSASSSTTSSTTVPASGSTSSTTVPTTSSTSSSTVPTTSSSSSSSSSTPASSSSSSSSTPPQLVQLV